MQRSSPGLEAALRLDRREQLLLVQVPLAEVPAERQAGHDLAVDPLVVLEAVDGLRHEERQRAAVQVHQAEAHHLADEAHRGRPVVEARELVVDPAGCSS